MGTREEVGAHVKEHEYASWPKAAGLLWMCYTFQQGDCSVFCLFACLFFFLNNHFQTQERLHSPSAQARHTGSSTQPTIKGAAIIARQIET